MSGELSGAPARLQTAFAEALLSEPTLMLSTPPAEVAAAARTTGHIGIELPFGVRLIVDGTVDAKALSRVSRVLAQ